MRVGQRGQVTIPEEIRERFSIGPDTEVEFRVVDGAIVLTKIPLNVDLEKWKGHSRDSFADLGYSTVDEYIDDVRGR